MPVSMSQSGANRLAVPPKRWRFDMLPYWSHSTYIGTGKLEEVREMLDKHGSCTIVFDAELSPGQQKALENAFNKQIIQNDFLGSEQLVSFLEHICIAF